MKVIPVDCNYVGKEFASAYLLVHQGRGFFVECNTNYAIPYLVKAAQEAGLGTDQIDGLVITHVHLDHAGGAGLFLKEFPQSKVYAHPRAARHLMDPSKLIASATAVYGESFMQQMYGSILPAASDRVVVLEDGAPIEWNGLAFRTRHTRGHANHHLCIVVPETSESPATVFTGDSFGVSYPQVNRKHGVVIIPSTSPTDFDGEAALETVEWIAALNRTEKVRAAPTHFGFIDSKEVPRAAAMLKDQLQFSIELVSKIKTDFASGVDVTESDVSDVLQDWTNEYFSKRGIQFDEADLKLLRLDFKVNAQGLLFTAKK